MRLVGLRRYFIVDIGLNFNTTYVDSETAQLVRKPAMIKANCARAPTLCRSACRICRSAAPLLLPTSLRLVRRCSYPCNP